MSMTATKRAREAPIRVRARRKDEASFRAVVETLPSPVFVSCGERFHYGNHAAESVTGYTQGELLSMDFCDLVPPDAQEAVTGRGGAHGEIGFPSRREVRILTKNREECWLEVIAATIDFDGVPAKLFSAASRVRERIAKDSEQPTFSASIGVAVYPQDGETIEDLLQAADRELYKSKSQGAEQASLLVTK